MLALPGVGAWRVHDADHAQQVHRRGDPVRSLAAGLARHQRPVGERRRVVVGVTPSSSTGWPSRAFTKALLPALNSPITTSRSSSSSWRTDRRSVSVSSAGASSRARTDKRSERSRALLGQQALLRVRQDGGIQGPYRPTAPQSGSRRSQPPSKTPAFASHTIPCAMPWMGTSASSCPRDFSRASVSGEKPSSLVREPVGQPLVMEARRVEARPGCSCRSPRRRPPAPARC